MVTNWEDIFNNELKYQNFSANNCNEVAHEVIAKRERPFVVDTILEAANKGCFSTTLPIVSQDTRNWLVNLNFHIYSGNDELKISWNDEVIKMDKNLFNRVIKGLEACIREDCENCEYHKKFVHGCDRMIVEARELILEQQHDLETLQNFYDKQEESIWGDTWVPHDECW